MKFALIAFNGEPMCFVHVLLNALDMAERGHQVQIVIEGSATALAKSLHEDGSQPFAGLYRKAREQGLIGCVCKACSAKMGALESAQQQGLAVCDEMNGHPAVARFVEDGWQVVSF